MKNALIILFAAAALALGVVYVVQWQKRDAAQAQIDSLRGKVDQKDQEIADLQAAQKLIETQRRESLDQAARLADKLQTRQRSDAKAPGSVATDPVATVQGEQPGQGKRGFGELFAKMMDDPEAKKFIRDQQRIMMDQLYAPLVKQMSLSPEEAAKFKDLLADNMMKGAEKATSLFGGGTATNRTEMIHTLTEEQKSFDEQVREFLGEGRYAQYKDYQQTVGERTQLNQFRQQTAGNENALSDQQTEQLLAIIKEEKQAVAAATGQPLPGMGQDQANMQAMLSGEGTEKLIQTQDTINQRAYERARQVLTPGQLEPFGQFQTNQLRMMRLGMNMARKFMGTDEAQRTPPSNP